MIKLNCQQFLGKRKIEIRKELGDEHNCHFLDV